MEYSVNRILKEALIDNGFTPIPHTAKKKEDAEIVQKQRVIVARSISDALESIPCLTNLGVEQTIYEAGRIILNPPGSPYECQANKRANRYFPEVKDGKLVDAKEVKIIGGDDALISALKIPPRLAKAVNLSITRHQALSIFLYKKQEDLFARMKELYQKIYDEFGEYKDLRE
ncbi:MAG: hypothetical protein AABX17_00785 [Nanoarchaeota archaeon]